jgi:hypothetical protein
MNPKKLSKSDDMRERTNEGCQLHELHLRVGELTIREEGDDFGDDERQNPSCHCTQVNIKRYKKHFAKCSQRIPAQTLQPSTVCSFLWREFSKMRKNTKRADTEAYKTPKKIKVGIMKEKATFLYTSCREPKAGAVMY